MEKYHIIQNEGFGESRVQYNVSFCTVLLNKFKNIDLKSGPKPDFSMYFYRLLNESTNLKSD